MRTYWGRNGHTVTLPCSVLVPEDSNFSLEWRKNNKLILSAYGNERGHVAPSLQGSVARDNGLGLTLHAVTSEDAGLYNCIVTRFTKQPTRPEHGAPLRLVVNVIPKIISPSNGHIEFRRVGESINIECKAVGAPPPEVTWVKNDRIVSSSLVLHISQLAESDKGCYSCLAVNVEGKAIVTVEVKFSKATSFDFVPTNKTVIEGSNVFWHCHANAQPEKIAYNWVFQERPIKTTQAGLRADIKDGDLSLRDVRKTDRGWYRCEVTNSRGDLSQSSAYLNVLYLPEVLPSHRQIITIGVGQNGTLSCDVDANPRPTQYTWSKNGYFLLSSEQNSYFLFSAKHTDGGIYSCVAENSVGKSAVLETHVIIAEPPVFTSSPPPELKVSEGASVEVPCEGFGDPLPIVYWVHNESRISSAVLLFSPVSHSDHGLYECVVSNSVSTITAPMQLIIERSRPQMAVIKSVECDGESAFIIDWEPGYNGSYAQSFVLHYMNMEQSISRSIAIRNNSIRIDELTPFASYKIVVESRNKRGSTNSSSIEKYVCSILTPPVHVTVYGGNELRWDPVPGARSYKVESRKNKKTSFLELGEVVHPFFRLSSEMTAQEIAELRVRSLRPPYNPSAPSNVIKFGLSELSGPSLWWAMLGGFLCFFFLATLYIFSKYFKPTSILKQDKRKYRNDRYVCPISSQMQTETFYEPSLKLLSGECLESCGSRDNSIRTRYPEGMIECDYDYYVGEDETCSAVDDMLKEKYIYGTGEISGQLINDLRIERLRREFKQSQL